MNRLFALWREIICKTAGYTMQGISLDETSVRYYSIETLSILFPRFRIVWQPTGLETMIIHPDIAIYDKSDTLLALGLSGHATAKNSAGMKVDRSIEELFEAKESLPPSTIIFSIIWHSPNGWSTGHLKRMDEAFDYNFVVYRECHDIWRTLVPEINILAESIKGADEPTSRQLVKESTIPNKLAKYMSPLRSIIANHAVKNSDVWDLIRTDYQPIPAYKSVFDSHIKEALTPLLWLPLDRLDLIVSGKSIKKDDISDTFIRLGGASETTVGVKPNNYISKLISVYSKEIIKNTVSQLQTADGISSLLESLNSVDTISSRIKRTEQAIADHTLYDLCESASDRTDVDYTGRCWPFEICTTWIKLKVDNKFGLLEAQREALGDTKTDYGWDPIIYYTEGYFDHLDSASVKKICSYFETTLHAAKRISSTELSSSLLRESRKEKANNPLQWIIKETLKYHNIDFDEKLSFQCPFAKRAGLNASSGRTTFQLYLRKSGKTVIIHALSAYSSTHKHVEFSGKSRLYDLSSPEAADIIYVLDGDKWSEQSAYMFERAGAKTVSADHFEDWVVKIIK